MGARVSKLLSTPTVSVPLRIACVVSGDVARRVKRGLRALGGALLRSPISAWLGTPSPSPPVEEEPLEGAEAIRLRHGLAWLTTEVPPLVDVNGGGASDLRAEAYLECFLEHDRWALFDPFELCLLSGRRPLAAAARGIVSVRPEGGLHDGPRGYVPIDWGKFDAAVDRVEAKMLAVRYHNATHVAQALHTLHVLLEVCGLFVVVTPFEAFAAYFAVIAHDVEHPGVSSAFLVEARDPLALRYGNVSVLERHHAAHALALLADGAETDFLCDASTEARLRFHELVRELIVSTDMARHQEVIDGFNREVSHSGLTLSASQSMVTLQMLVKLADFGHAALANFQVHINFVARLREETNASMPAPATGDFSLGHVAPAQIAFLDEFVLPLAEAFHAVFDVSPVCDRLRATRRRWAAVLLGV